MKVLTVESDGTAIGTTIREEDGTWLSNVKQLVVDFDADHSVVQGHLVVYKSGNRNEETETVPVYIEKLTLVNRVPVNSVFIAEENA